MSSDDLDTKPTIETVLNRINALAEKMDAQSTDIKDIKKDIAELRERSDEYDIRFDRLEKVILQTRSEFVEMRADLKEWRKQLKDVLPPVA